MVYQIKFDTEVAERDGTLQDEEKQLTGSLKDLIKIRRHAINLLILVVVWVASSFNYYLINFKMKYIEGNIFVNNSVAATTEMVAYLVGGFAYQKIGIRLTLAIAFCISCIGSICLNIWRD